VHRERQGGQDYYELIKAKSPNFPSKRQPLLVTPSPDLAIISRVKAQRERERQSKVGGGDQ